MIGYRFHELRRAFDEFVVMHVAVFGVQIQHHDRKIDMFGRGVGIFGLHDVAVSQDRCLVLDDKTYPAFTVGQHSAVANEFFTGLKR